MTVTEGGTDQPTDQKVAYRVTCPRLKSRKEKYKGKDHSAPSLLSLSSLISPTGIGPVSILFSRLLGILKEALSIRPLVRWSVVPLVMIKFESAKTPITAAGGGC